MYDNQINNLRNIIPNSRNILIALPTGANIDKLAAGLALYLSLKQQGKEVTIASDETIRVGHSHLFAIDKIKQNITTGGGNNFILTLENVATQDVSGGSVPSLDRLDYAVEGTNLNLVFKVLPGQTFQPSRIVPRYESSANFDLILILGAASLNDLGNIYNQNNQIFGSAQTVNIDNSANNTQFSQTNIVDSNASSVSEVTTFVMNGSDLVLEGDIATNLLAGIYDATDNLAGTNVSANTFEAVALALKAGGQRPQVNNVTQAQSVQPNQQNTNTQPINLDFSKMPQTPGFDLSALMPQEEDVKRKSESTTPVVAPQPAVEEVPQEQQAIPAPTPITSQNMPSAEERPYEEGVVTEAEPDWLTPKIYRGSSIG